MRQNKTSKQKNRKWTLAQCYLPNLDFFSNLTNFSTGILFLFQGLIQDPVLNLLIVFPQDFQVYNSSLVCPHLSWPSHFWGLPMSYFKECHSIWICVMFPFHWSELMHFCQEISPKQVFSHCKEFVMSICPITCHIYLDHLVKGCLLGWTTVNLLPLSS